MFPYIIKLASKADFIKRSPFYLHNKFTFELI
ncbi:Uncharacterised protein [Sphingobacterium mizutaii]|uniref:Uncharacterized protein n=1 Tax=Sphingobacterium mizutaii TaxID=1010 RepID=A0AAJ4X9M4_9SPHI|nr:hypothetical protein SAMN05192578_103223 [Sphingobacterium mizutaii]SNV44379.1 Uncharacterised protein [Sphingobacterium mizutaii]